MAFVIAMLPTATFAHEPGTSIAHQQCDQPIRPADDVAPPQWNAFLSAVDAFRECTNRVMDQHQRAATTHQQAAKTAVDEWNLFVRHSLNAPKDFPHAPQTTRSRSYTDSGIAEVNGGYSGHNPEAELRPQFDVETDKQRLTIRREVNARD